MKLNYSNFESKAEGEGKNIKLKSKNKIGKRK